MRKSRSTESQIVLRNDEVGLTLVYLVRNYGIGRTTYVKREVEVCRTTVAKVRRLYADVALENGEIEDVLSRKL